MVEWASGPREEMLVLQVVHQTRVRTAAMAVRLTDHIWTWQQFLTMPRKVA